MKHRSKVSVLAAVVLAAWAEPAKTADFDEFRVKREAVFEFDERPAVAREDGGVVITFASRGLCDATVAIEDSNGNIVRHLACGVLGANPPEPFQKNSNRQKVIWDGNDEAGKPATLDGLTVRVSLGLKPRFERTLYWQPKRKFSASSPLIAASPEGVYVFTGSTVDSLCLYSHGGDYLRTVYPFPAEKLKEVEGLAWTKFPQIEDRLPLKQGVYKTTLLTSGDLTFKNIWAADAMAVRGRRIALARLSLNRLGADGTSGGLPLGGPVTYVMKDKVRVTPQDAALSPDGKRLYLAGYFFREKANGPLACLPDVLKVDYEGNAEPGVFVGSGEAEGGGNGPEELGAAVSVACDAQGRVYAADYPNDRLQIYSPEGKHLKSIATPRPACVRVHAKTGEVYVFSWMIHPTMGGAKEVAPTMTRFGPFENPTKLAHYALPGVNASWGDQYGKSRGARYRAEVDSWVDPPGIWVSREHTAYSNTTWENTGTLLMVPEGGKLVVRRDFAEEASKSVDYLPPPLALSQYCYVDPRTGKLFLGESHGRGTYSQRYMKHLIEIDPPTGAHRLVKLPFLTADLAFGINGLAYLRVNDVIMRYNLETGTHVPWKAGKEFNISGESGRGIIKSGIYCPPSNRFAWQGGMSASPSGHFAAFYRAGSGRDGLGTADLTTFPGRRKIDWAAMAIGIWDPDGRLLTPDAVPGVSFCDGIALGRNRDLTVMEHQTRERYPIKTTGTVVRYQCDDGKYPGPPKVAWQYGGVGFAHPPHCLCYHSRFAQDYFGRSFAPEQDIFRVAVLDSAGNLILRIGKYGNVEDGRPVIAGGGPMETRSVGGDEVALVQANYVGTHTDRRLFIADAGNGRIVSAKLDYHATERVGLK